MENDDASLLMTISTEVDQDTASCSSSEKRMPAPNPNDDDNKANQNQEIQAQPNVRNNEAQSPSNDYPYYGPRSRVNCLIETQKRLELEDAKLRSWKLTFKPARQELEDAKFRSWKLKFRPARQELEDLMNKTCQNQEIQSEIPKAQIISTDTEVDQDTASSSSSEKRMPAPNPNDDDKAGQNQEIQAQPNVLTNEAQSPSNDYPYYGPRSRVNCLIETQKRRRREHEDAKFRSWKLKFKPARQELEDLMNKTCQNKEIQSEIPDAQMEICIQAQNKAHQDEPEGSARLNVLADEDQSSSNDYPCFGPQAKIDSMVRIYNRQKLDGASASCFDDCEIYSP